MGGVITAAWPLRDGCALPKTSKICVAKQPNKEHNPQRQSLSILRSNADTLAVSNHLPKSTQRLLAAISPAMQTFSLTSFPQNTRGSNVNIFVHTFYNAYYSSSSLPYIFVAILLVSSLSLYHSFTLVISSLARNNFLCPKLCGRPQTLCAALCLFAFKLDNLSNALIANRARNPMDAGAGCRKAHQGRHRARVLVVRSGKYYIVLLLTVWRIALARTTFRRFCFNLFLL